MMKKAAKVQRRQNFSFPKLFASWTQFCNEKIENYIRWYLSINIYRIFFEGKQQDGQRPLHQRTILEIIESREIIFRNWFIDQIEAQKCFSAPNKIFTTLSKPYNLDDMLKKIYQDPRIIESRENFRN